MIKLMEVNGFRATVDYDPDIEMFRGEFVGLNGCADFYSDSVKGLKREAERSLQEFVAFCEERGLPVKKDYSGRFKCRVDPQLHEEAVLVARAAGISLNKLVEMGFEHELKESV